MTKARVFTTAGLIHLTVAALLALTFAFGRPATVAGYSKLGFTPTPTSPPDNGKEPKPQPELTIVKSVEPTDVLPGDLVTIVVKVCNVGDGVAKDVVVSDNVPGELEVLGAKASQGRAVIVGNGVRAEFGDLLPGVCATLTITAQVRADVPPGTQIDNVATIGDLVSNRVTLTVGGLLPVSGDIMTPVSVAGFAMLGGALLAMGLRFQKRQREVVRERE
jgi:uncharacterized repeat protein (TIGR01451 family)